MSNLDEKLKHCEGLDCKCKYPVFASKFCTCGADWTPAEVYTLMDRIERAKQACMGQRFGNAIKILEEK